MSKDILKYQNNYGWIFVYKRKEKDQKQNTFLKFYRTACAIAPRCCIFCLQLRQVMAITNPIYSEYLLFTFVMYQNKSHKIIEIEGSGIKFQTNINNLRKQKIKETQKIIAVLFLKANLPIKYFPQLGQYQKFLQYKNAQEKNMDIFMIKCKFGKNVYQKNHFKGECIFKANGIKYIWQKLDNVGNASSAIMVFNKYEQAVIIGMHTFTKSDGYEGIYLEKNILLQLMDTQVKYSLNSQQNYKISILFPIKLSKQFLSSLPLQIRQKIQPQPNLQIRVYPQSGIKQVFQHQKYQNETTKDLLQQRQKLNFKQFFQQNKQSTDSYIQDEQANIYQR